ncbi:MAG: fibronectin type III domain-containing protein, partial [Solirubrobacteraceae bacterium]
GARTSYQFQWGLTNTYGAASNFHALRGGTAFVAVSATAPGLIPGTVYHFRVIAVSALGTSTGRDHTFTTAGHPPPGVTTGPATSISQTAATVTGTVNPNGQATTWEFQYGPTPSPTAQTIAQTLPAGHAPESVGAQLSGLTPGTWFYYHLVALHGSAVVQSGLPAMFLTEPSPRPVPSVRASTTPHRDRRRPYVFTTGATVVLPSSIPAAYGCNGTATIRYLFGRRVIRTVTAGVQSNCTLGVQTGFNRLPGRGSAGRQVTLKIAIEFNGNGYLAPAKARAEHVRLG